MDEVFWVNYYTLESMFLEIYVVYSLNASFNAPNQAKIGQNPTLALQVNLVVHIQ